MSKTLKKLDNLTEEYEKNVERMKKLPKGELNDSCVFFYEVFVDELIKVKEVYQEEHGS